MEIQHHQNEKGGRFYIAEPDDSTTELVYKISATGEMVIEHTEVGERYEGKGVGHMLVDRAVEYARENNMKVLPMCVFAKAIMRRSDQYKDVLVINY